MYDGTGPLGRALLVSVVVLAAVVGGAAVVTAQEDSVSLLTDGGHVTVSPTENATIRGTSDLSAGETLTVRLRSSGDTQPRFLKTDEVTVDENGNFSATFDFSELPKNATFTVTVAGDSGTLAEAEGEVSTEQETTTTTESTESTESLVPGFGPVTVVGAFVALTAGALLVGRR